MESSMDTLDNVLCGYTMDGWSLSTVSGFLCIDGGGKGHIARN
jgi:hypothetical protein